jgi:hypothetical protein
MAATRILANMVWCVSAKRALGKGEDVDEDGKTMEEGKELHGDVE